jgi:hypothetical protein
MTHRTDLYDTTNCPQGTFCQNCANTDDLDIVAFGSMLGVFCATLCVECRHNPAIGELASQALGWFGVAYYVHIHCEHLDIDMEAMSATMNEEGTSK